MLDEKTIELEELKSTEKLHEVIEENVLSDLRKSSDESIEFNSFQSKEAVKIKPTKIRAAVVKDQIPLKESTKQLEEEGKLKVQSGHNPASKDRPSLADQHHHEVTSKILNNVIFCEKVYSREFMFENKLIMVHDPYGFRLLVMGKRNYGILEQILVEKLINIIKFLTIDAVEKANSDHSGLPKGCALMGHILYDEVMRYKSKNPYWFNCDRFVLSAGHSCMLKYDLLHLTSYDSVREDDLKNFRQWGSKTPGHPENFETPRVEVTTSLLDQDITNIIGLALAEKHLAARFNKPNNEIIDHYTYVIMGDGCQIEGISNEACSLAGHWGFWKLIAFYDDNHIFIDGDTEIAFTENVDKHFDGHRWHVTWVKKGNTGYDDIRSAIKEAKTVKDKPILIKVTTTIGFGSPNKANSYNVHGGALGAKEVDAIRKNLGWPYEPFHILEDVKGMKLVVVTTEMLKPNGAFIAAKEKLGDGSQPVSTLSLDKRVVPKRIPFKHPSTFNTLAMDPVKKQPVMDDLRDFANDQSFYPKTGKAWKRGYLLDSPSRTGESNMIAAMAIYLSYNIYDLEFFEFHNNSELRKLLMKTSSKSIIVIEDIDCSMNLTNKKKNNNKPSIRAYSDLEMRYRSSSIFCEDGENSITLSGLLNFIDELWSCYGSERIFVFTTNHIERLEPALLKSGRMDMHNYRSCCSYPEFWILLKNYLGYEESDLDGNVLKGLTKVVDKAKIRVQFKHVPSNLYKRNFGTDFDKATNELVLRVQPDEIIYLKNNNKVPGLGMRLDRSDLNLLFQARYPREIRDVYERLLLDAIAGERRLFIKSDEFSATWSPFTPLLKELEEEKDCQELYLYGSRGLIGAHYLAAKYNVRWKFAAIVVQVSCISSLRTRMLRKREVLLQAQMSLEA